jgi:signal transduction histidine kinase
MPRVRDLPIRLKMLALLALSSIFSLVVAGAAMIVYDLVVFKKNSIAGLSVHAEMLGAVSGAALIFNDAQSATEYLATLKARQDTTCAALYKADGGVFATYQRAGERQCVIPPVQPAGYQVEGDDLLMFTPIEHHGEHVGTVYLRHRMARVARALSYTGIVAVVLVGALLLGLLASSVMQRVVTQPLLQMAHVAKGVTERRDYSLRVAKEGNDEVGLLTDAFNQMLAETARSSTELRLANEQLRAEITEHQRAREALDILNATLEQRVAQRTQQLELSNKELESFSYSVSHDLRTPLRAIEGFSSALLRSYAERLDDRGRDYLQRVRAATKRMGNLIDDLLNLARTMRAEIRRSNVDLSEMAANVAKEIADTHPDWPLQFTIQPGLVASVDPQLMRAALENLLGNAAKFSSKKPQPRVEFSSAVQDDQTVYVVRDNGVGFDMSYAHKLFGAFQRLHAAHEFEGTGIGLANVQRIVQRHGGSIWVEAQPGRGASFFFTLPT